MASLSSPSTARFRRGLVAAAASVAVAGVVTAGVDKPAHAASSINGAMIVSVGAPVRAPAIPAGFAGLSLEYTTVLAYAGKDPSVVDPVFVQLVRNIAPGQRPVLRIGGDTTDWTWWPIPGMAKPPWARYGINQKWIGVMHSISQQLNAQLILGINLEANSPPIAAAEANGMLQGLGRNAILAFELGNEPELYGSYSWYRTARGGHVTGRSRHYNFAGFTHDFSNIAAQMPQQVPLAGPGTGGSRPWTRPLHRFLSREPRLGLVTMHRYGVDGCSRLVSIANLLSEKAQRGLADSVVTPYRVARRDHVPLRIEEMNTVACGGQAGVSNTFAAALWLLDTLFEAARVGVAGVNVHTNPADNHTPTHAKTSIRGISIHRKSSGLNSLFDFHMIKGVWHAAVRPEYYGMVMFGQAAPPGSRLLQTANTPRPELVHTWATVAPDGTRRVVLINESGTQSRVVFVRVSHAHGAAKLERLRARQLSATGGVTLGRHGFGASTTTGRLAAPVQTRVALRSGHYRVYLPSSSAAMLTISKPAARYP